MSNYELPLTISVSLQRGSEIRGAPNQQNRRRHLMEQALQYAMRSQSASCPPLQQAIVRRGYILSLQARERLGEKGGAFLKGKESRVGFRKDTPYHLQGDRSYYFLFFIRQKKCQVLKIGSLKASAG